MFAIPGGTRAKHASLTRQYARAWQKCPVLIPLPGYVGLSCSTPAATTEGLLFAPYLSGERTPYRDPNARGLFFGLTLRHGKPHLTRSVLEGATFRLLGSLELVRKLGVSTREVRVSGGGARSPVWRQIVADLFATEIATVNVTEGAAFGAALLTGVGAGMYGSVVDACTAAIRLTGRTAAGLAQSAYSRYYPRYWALYPALQAEFQALATLADRQASSSSPLPLKEEGRDERIRGQ